MHAAEEAHLRAHFTDERSGLRGEQGSYQVSLDALTGTAPGSPRRDRHLADTIMLEGDSGQPP